MKRLENLFNNICGSAYDGYATRHCIDILIMSQQEDSAGRIIRNNDGEMQAGLKFCTQLFQVKLNPDEFLLAARRVLRT